MWYLLCQHNKSTIWWLFHQTNEFSQNILYTNIMYQKVSIDVKITKFLEKNGGMRLWIMKWTFKYMTVYLNLVAFCCCCCCFVFSLNQSCSKIQLIMLHDLMQYESFRWKLWHLPFFYFNFMWSEKWYNDTKLWWMDKVPSLVTPSIDLR